MASKKRKKNACNCRKKTVSNIIQILKKSYKSLKASLSDALCKLSLLLKSLKKALLIAVLVLSTILASVSAPYIHADWLETKVGNDTLLIRGAAGLGSSFQVRTAKGSLLTVTNHHVCALADSMGMLQVWDSLTGQYTSVKILKMNKHADLCVLTGILGHTGLTLGRHASVGTKVYAFGYPYGEALNITGGRVKTETTITLLDHIGSQDCDKPGQKVENLNLGFFRMEVCMVQFKAMALDNFIYPGNSGGPLVNSFGEVVGVIFAASERTHWGYAVRLVDLEAILAEY